MKIIGDQIFFADGEWWFRQRVGTRQRAKITLCETCKEEFAAAPSSKTAYCCNACRRKQCGRCGKTFSPTSNHNAYCSLRCRRGVGECEQCGKEYVFSHHGAKRFCSLKCFYEHESPYGSQIRDSTGYMLVKVPPGTPGIKTRYGYNKHGWMLAHRYVMQIKLGRPLLKTERVHHINGRKDDNRPENLELWKRTHPAGVRAADYHCAGCRCFEQGG
jgi:hypothetical protein